MFSISKTHWVSVLSLAILFALFVLHKREGYNKAGPFALCGTIFESSFC